MTRVCPTKQRFSARWGEAENLLAQIRWNSGNRFASWVSVRFKVTQFWCIITMYTFITEDCKQLYECRGWCQEHVLFRERFASLDLVHCSNVSDLLKDMVDMITSWSSCHCQRCSKKRLCPTIGLIPKTHQQSAASPRMVFKGYWHTEVKCVFQMLQPLVVKNGFVSSKQKNYCVFLFSCWSNCYQTSHTQGAL